MKNYLVMALFKKSKKSSRNSDKSIETVNRVKTDVLKYRNNFSRLWRDEEEAYHGKIWNLNENKPYENQVFRIIQDKLPDLTDSLPGVMVETDDPIFTEQTDNLRRSVDWVFKDQNYPAMFTIAVWQSLISAPGFIHQYYDANADGGDGKIINELVNWRHVGLGGTSPFIERCTKARIELKREKEWLKITYPEFSEEIDEMDAEHDNEEKVENEGREQIDTNSGGRRRKVPPPYRDKDTLTLVKTFKKDYSLESIPEEQTQQELADEQDELLSGSSPDLQKWQDHEVHIDAHMSELEELYGTMELTPDVGFEVASEVVDALLQENPEADFANTLFMIKVLETHIDGHKILLEENPKSQRPKYPGGYRQIETIHDLVVYDGKNKDDHGMIPLVPYYCYRDGTLWGQSEVRNILDSQRMSSIMQYKEFKGLQRVANPIILYDKESGLTDDDITNEDGAVYGMPQGTTMTHLTGAINNQVTSFHIDRTRVMDDISGGNDLSEGKMPSPNAAAATIERIDIRQKSRVRLKDRQNQLYSTRRLGIMTAHNILQYWTSDKVLGIEHEGEDSTQIVFRPLEMKDMKFTIGIAPGSMAGVDVNSFNNYVFQLLAGGQITFDEYLEVVKGTLPKIEKIQELMAKRNETQAVIEEKDAQIEQLATQIDQTSQENILIRGNLAPETLTQEERKIFDEIIRQQTLQSISGVNQDQPEQQI